MNRKPIRTQTPARPRRVWLRRILWTVLGALCVGGLSLGIAWSIYSRDVDQYLALFALRVPKTTTKILDVRGNVIDVIAEEHRELIPFGDIPKPFIGALIATEDTGFYQHGGISYRGAARAALTAVATLGRRREGFSTLTMQLVKVVTNKRKKNLGRKLKEIILARKLEKAYTKEQILESYTNEVWFGGVGNQYYGLEAAARYYFDKAAINLNIDECAFLAGIIQSPRLYNPYLGAQQRERATLRRNHVLRRMVVAGFISEAQSKAAQQRPIRLGKEGGSTDSTAPYAREEIKNHLFQKYGKDKVLNGGLEVHTTLDGDWQAAANDAVRNGLRAVDRQRGFRPEDVRRTPEPEKVQMVQWKRLFTVGDNVRGVILEWKEQVAKVRIGSSVLDVPQSAFAWAGEKGLKALTRGAMPLLLVKAVDPNGLPTQVELDQEPDTEAALMAVDPTNGEIRAMVGGYDFKRSQFNRSFQAYRQVGSTMKAFVYGAAFSEGKSPATMVEDVPTTFHFTGQPPYNPKNYERDFWGPITIFEAIRDSRNVPAVRTLDDVGGSAFLEYARKCGIESRLDAYPASALGTADLTLKEMVRAYGTLANLGKQCPSPFLIKKVVDRDKKVLEQHGQTMGEQVVDAMATFQLVQCLQGVIFQGGTGGRAAELNWPIAGNTGTTQDHTDAWFIGFSTRISCGVWVGLDTKKPIFKKADGARVALPIWKDFMRKALATTPREEFEAPTGMDWADIDNYTGLKVAGKPEGKLLHLAFRPGAIPKGESDAAAILRIQDGREKAMAGKWPTEERTWGSKPISYDNLLPKMPIDWQKTEDPNKLK